ncbi:MAG: hypothetical protein MJ147_05010 [Clostridia bacterium]|nr:hypothetical protein [Clostridia bacterium]
MMKRIIAIILSVLLSFALCVPAFAEQGGICYYIDAINGNDSNDGTSPESAWQTVRRASENEFNAGDRLLLKCGQTFGGNLVPKGSGSENAPVVVSSYGEGNSPVIHASSNEFLFFINNVSHWVIENIEFTSQGIGALIYSLGDDGIDDITIRNCYFHDIGMYENGESTYALLIDNDSKGANVSNIHLDSLRIENVRWGIHTKGINAEDDRDTFISPEESYNCNYLFENIYIKNAEYGGIVIGGVRNGTIRNCRVLDCATAQDSAYAPLWIRHSDGITIEYCEIAGSTNRIDGMAIDFDGWTVNSTYRYIYSHDNTRFVKNCVFDFKTRNRGNTVCNCVSVNDNQKMNWGAVCLISTSRPSIGRMADFSFHDNIIVNGKPIFWICTKKPQIENIKFAGTKFMNFIQRLFNLFVFPKEFSYNEVDSEEIEVLINEITERLPE